MAKGDQVPPLPGDAPKSGELYRHYKRDLYRVVLLAEHSNDAEWMVVYEPMYANPDAPYFTRPLREWSELIEWNGETYKRFTKEGIEIGKTRSSSKKVFLSPEAAGDL